MPTAVSLFSGCGGSDAGLHAAGFQILLANDIMGYARDVYLANLPETDYKLTNIRTISKFPAAELLVGCYPCQGFSQGGVRDPSRGINYLYLEFNRALKAIRPKAFIVENVSGMVRSNFGHILEHQIEVFGEAGYRVKYSVLNAADYGVPQERKRIFIVGLRKNLGLEYDFPEPSHGAECANPYVTIQEAIADLPEWPDGEFYDKGFHWYYLSRNRRQEWNEVSKTIVSNPRHMPLHPMSPRLKKLGPDVWSFIGKKRARRFSYREAARLQGFGNDFVFPDTKQKSLPMCYKVAGNAVPPPLFEAVTRALPDVWD